MNHLGDCSLPLAEWLTCAQDFLKRSLSKEAMVVTLVGKNSLHRSIGDEVNDLLRYQAFPPWSHTSPDLGIDAYFSSEEDTLFLVVNSPNDEAHLQQILTSSPYKNFFEKLQDSEDSFLRMLEFCFMVSSVIVFIEPAPRLDMSLVRTLKAVNKMRISRKRTGSDHAERIFMPYLLFGFHRNVIRNELGSQKRKEIYEKLEKSLEEQIHQVLRNTGIISDAHDKDKDCLAMITYPKDRFPFVHLILPSVVNSDPLADLLDICLGKAPSEINDKKGVSESFASFLDSNITDVRMDRRNVQIDPQPTMVLSDLLPQLQKRLCVLDKPESSTAGTSFELKLMKRLTDRHVADAVAQYTRTYSSNDRERAVFTKAQHDQRFASAVAYLDSVLIGDRDAAMAQLRVACDAEWTGGLRGCEQQSLTGANCNLPVHPSIGDASVAESLWQLHSSGVTFISTCSCGRMQALRNDPFTVKEANYDFFHSNPNFTCCTGLERHMFPILEDEDSVVDVDGIWAGAEEDNWPRASGVGVLGLLAGGGGGERDNQMKRSGSGRGVMTRSADSTESSDGEGEGARRWNEESKLSYDTGESADSQTASSADEKEGDAEADDYRSTGRSYLDDDEKVVIREKPDNKRQMAIDFDKRVKKLESRKIPYLPGVPHTLTADLLPLFPSWTLTCIGSSSLYGHSHGLRDQPNFKLACEYLVPVDIPLQVDGFAWDKDMQCIQAMDKGYPSARNYRKPARTGNNDSEKVKLFVGFDYECPRGHRFFVGHDGEPLLLPKGQNARESALRDASLGLLSNDLPLRRQCTCRKLPHQTAQLCKIHIVTPKSPVSVTIHPVVMLPNQEGSFTTGDAPLRLEWGRYYILQLPFVYSGPSGVWIPPEGLDRVGKLEGNAIQVNYVPMTL